MNHAHLVGRLRLQVQILKKNARPLYIFEYSTGQNPQFEIEDSLILNLKLRIQYPYSLQDGFV